jgi:DNA-binding transcriptional MerR regulator
MRIGELSARSGVSPRSLRHYEKIGLLTSVRDPNGYRRYDPAIVERAVTIHTIFSLGFAREVAESVLTCTADAPPEVHRAVGERLVAVRDDLALRIAQLTHTHAALDAFLDDLGLAPQ